MIELEVGQQHFWWHPDFQIPECQKRYQKVSRLQADVSQEFQAPETHKLLILMISGPAFGRDELLRRAVWCQKRTRLNHIDFETIWIFSKYGTEKYHMPYHIFDGLYGLESSFYRLYIRD